MKKSPPKEHQFKPGQSGNPLGGKLHNSDIKKLKALGKAQVAELGRLVLSNSFDEIIEMTQDANVSVLKLWMARVVIKGVKEGDASTLNTLLPWIVGKVADEVQTTNVHLIDEALRIQALPKEQALIEYEETLKLYKAQNVRDTLKDKIE